MDYSKTINLPDTEFPMKAGLADNEPERLASWNDENLYEQIQDKREDDPEFILHDGPPYANGDIHIGHALNKILKDILIRFKTMQGYRAPYRPGWDCHGLPIEHKVTSENPEVKREGQMAVREACRDYSLEYVDVQREQFERLGVLGEWDEPYLTLTPDYEAEVLRSFQELNDKGYIYRQLKPIHWCWNCETALAEAEVEYDELTSPAIFVDFPVIEDPNTVLESPEAHFMIWTTTPWTIPANVAIAVHPELDYVEFEDPDGKVHVMAEAMVTNAIQRRDWSTNDIDILQTIPGEQLEDIICGHPLVDDRASTVILAELVTLEQGTGCVHIAPGHGQEDYEVGLDYNLPIISPVGDNGLFTDEYAPFEGEHVFDADPEIVQLLDERDALFHDESMDHSYPFCWRCDKPIIFRSTPQWFMDVDHNDLRDRILAKLDDIDWVPDWGIDRFRSMVEERPDWCLSRQRAWGVPIPALNCNDCGEAFLDNDLIDNLIDDVERNGVNVWFEESYDHFTKETKECPSCGSDDLSRGDDILDVWFDSGVSHQAVLRNDENLSWPADVYLEGSDQHRGWFQLSMIPSMALEDAPPYEEIITHGFVVDENGLKMSKSKGNVIAPQDVVQEDGADILRLWVASENYQEDLALSDDLLDQIRTRYRRIRNTCKFFLGNLQDLGGFSADEDAVEPSRMHPVDRWFVNEMYGLVHRVTRAYERRDFHLAMANINEFCAVEASSLYLDIAKDRLYCSAPDSHDRRSAQTACFYGLKTLVRLVAPVLSFTSDEVWEYFSDQSVHLEDWPDPADNWEAPNVAEDFHRLRKIREEVLRAIEQEDSVDDQDEADVTISWPGAYGLLDQYRDILEEWFIVADASIVEGPSDRVITVEPSEYDKCDRCWRYRETVRERSEVEQDELCDRCAEL
ncbi:MAG: isoleucine--tRNA ligase [bacterium]